MIKNFVEELKWRGMLQDIMPGTEEQLQKEVTTGYAGFDPTADSLGIGNMVSVMLLKHFQLCGHKPIVLVGGATGMIGDPSGKKEERKLLTEDILNHNLSCQKKQLEKFLDFSGSNAAEIVNNYDWFKDIRTVNFLREVGKYLTVNYLLSKGFTKDRLGEDNELSFTEFNYILIQAYDFLWLYENKNCKVQLGGSDQWGNMTAGTELIRKKIRGKAFAATAPLVTKSDGSKFGKSESGNIWIDAKKTSPYKFYQFWLNTADDDAKKYIRIFTVLSKPEIESLEIEHFRSPHLRLLQRKLAEEVTTFIHSKDDLLFAQKASEILFGQFTAETLFSLSDSDFKDVFEGVPSATVSKSEIENGIQLLDLIVDKTKFFPSKGEAKRTLQGNGFSLNKTQIAEADYIVKTTELINGKYILLQKGKKNYFLVVAE